MDSPGWELFSKLVNEQRRLWTKNIVGSEESGLDGLIELGKNKSYLAGMQFAFNLPTLFIRDLIDEAAEVANDLQTLEEMEDEQTS